MPFPMRQRDPVPAEVISVVPLSSHFRRVTVSGPALRGVRATPAQWMTGLFPVPEDAMPTARPFTIAGSDPEAGRIDFDFALHGGAGPAARWIVRCRSGDTLGLLGPQGGFTPDPAADRLVLIGDATALPAIRSILAGPGRRPPAEVIAEVAECDDERMLKTSGDVNIEWLHSAGAPPGTTGQIELAVQRRLFAGVGTQVWLAGESDMVRAVQTHLLLDQALPRTSIEARSTWTAGRPNVREEVAQISFAGFPT
ncbi:MAG: siderophore-interacting protein [Telmatospirillum sp.]|nr:siderophore-interacting protein [Telmatospirillum sp.]